MQSQPQVHTGQPVVPDTKDPADTAEVRRLENYQEEMSGSIIKATDQDPMFDFYPMGQPIGRSAAEIVEVNQSFPERIGIINSAVDPDLTGQPVERRGHQVGSEGASGVGELRNQRT